VLHRQICALHNYIIPYYLLRRFAKCALTNLLLYSDSFLKYNVIPSLGLADEATVTMMQKPRCAMKDVETELGSGHSGRQKRFVHRGGRWRRRTLTYGVVQDQYPRRRMSRSSTNVVLKEAFQVRLSFEICFWPSSLSLPSPCFSQ
jgi:hypothetical protein